MGEEKAAVMPMKAGIPWSMKIQAPRELRDWIPAFAGMTVWCVELAPEFERPNVS